MSETKKEFFDAVVSVKRVTKVTKGGKRFSFSAFVVSGDQQGNVGIGMGKSNEVSSAISKAKFRAHKNFQPVALRGTTIPYNIKGKHGAAKVEICSASQGTGVIAGGGVRSVIVAVGIKDVLAKVVGKSRSGVNVVKATLNALAKLRTADRIAHMRGKASVKELIKG